MVLNMSHIKWGDIPFCVPLSKLLGADMPPVPPVLAPMPSVNLGAGLKRATHSSLKIQEAKIRHLGNIAQLCRAISSQLRHVSTIGELWPTSG